MAPVASYIALLLAGASAIDAKPLMPGRHAPPGVANLLSSHVKKGLHKALASYYGAERGLTKPPKLNTKRAVIPAGWTYSGCVDESWNQRLLQGMGFSSSGLTPSVCLSTCQASGFTLAGMEYADECYCGNAFVGSGGNKVSDSTCNMGCKGDSTAMCGGNWFLSVYSYNTTSANACVPAGTGAITTATTATTTQKTTTATTTTGTKTTQTAPVHTDASDASEWYALGCALDHGNTHLLTGYAQQYIGSLTTDWCLSTCEDKGFAFAGLEYGQECYCGNTVPTTISYTDGACQMPCTGDKTDTCGGYYYMELYELISSANKDCPVTNTTATSIPNNNYVAITTTTAAGAAITTAAAAPTTVPAASGDHAVWAHHMVGNTYPYTQANWATDIQLAVAAGIDGFALNMGSDSWQPDRINDAYTAAANSGTGFKLFLSLDMTVMGCWSSSDANNLVNLVKRWANHPNQAMHNGKILVSTFAGSDCNFGQGGSSAWQNMFVDPLKNSGTNIFFVPSLFSDISTFAGNTWMDGELNWNSGWPTGNNAVSTAFDQAYIGALAGKEYMAAVSPYFFTHYGANSWNKNWLYKGDDWLYCTRWEQIISMRQQVKMTEILTWNDFGESSYIGPIQGAMPTGTEAWVNGFDHQGLNVLTKYYITAYKTGAYPAITKDSVTMWVRPHPHDATASSDSVGRPTGWDWTTDYVWAVVLAQSAGTVTLTSGSSSSTFAVSAGLTKLKIPAQAGGISGSITRNGQVTASYTSSGFQYTNNPSTYNYNYFVGSSS